MQVGLTMSHEHKMIRDPMHRSADRRAERLSPLPHKGSSWLTIAWKPSRLLASIAGFVVMPRRRWSKRRVVSSGYVVIPLFYRFEAEDTVRWNMNAW